MATRQQDWSKPIPEDQESGKVKLVLINQADIVMRVTALDGEFAQPITAERRASRLVSSAPEGNLATREQSATAAENIPEANMDYPGAQYCGELETELGLESREEYRRLQDYLAYYNQSPTAVKKDNRCLYNSIRRRWYCPFEFTADHLKRQIVDCIVKNKDFSLVYMWKHILYEYNDPLGANKNFSFKSYLLYLLEQDTWGDEMVLNIVSIMWNQRVTLLYPKSLRKLGIRHSNLDLKKVDIVVIYAGGCHYSAVVPVPPDSDLPRVDIECEENYRFEDEDPGIYSDCKEPHTCFSHEAYPNRRKNLPQIRRRTGYEHFQLEHQTAEELGSGAGAGGTLSKIATLVQQEQALLQEAGVIPVPPGSLGQQQQPGTSSGMVTGPGVGGGAPGPTLSTRAKEAGAYPRGKCPTIKPGDLTCPVCKKTFTQTSRLQGHYDTNHAYQGRFMCTICITPFSSQVALDQHKLTHDKFKCFIQYIGQSGLQCQRFYDTLDLLRQHINTDPVYSQVPIENRCPHCLQAFKGKTPQDNLKKHIKYRCDHNPDVKIVYGFCKFCGKRYRKIKYLKDHESVCATKQGGKRGGQKGQWGR